MKPLLLILLLSACTTERYLTPEQDADMKANGEAEGCTIVPNALMLKLLERLKGVLI